MDIDEETSTQRSTALRIGLGSLGTLVILLLMLVLIRPDMAMGALHHMEARIGMDVGPTR